MIPYANTTMRFADICARLGLINDPLANALIAPIVFNKKQLKTTRPISEPVIKALDICGLEPSVTESPYGYRVINWRYPEIEKIKKAAAAECADQTA